ncbi:MAG: response regulator [Proteobacteria bacterium]|nr:response regulator [Pseudomonadota bacterium]
MSSEVGAFFLVPFLDYTEETLGPEGKAALLERIGIAESELRDKSTWVTLAQCEEACAVLVELHDDPFLFEEKGGLALQRRYTGPLRPILRALAGPGFAYRALPKTLPRFNKVGAFEVLVDEPGHVQLAYTTSVPERNVWIHKARVGQMAAFPTLFDLPPATVDVLESFADSDRCVYDIHYQVPSGRAMALTLALVGVGIGSLAAGVSGADAGVILASTGLWGIVGYLTGTNLELRATLATRSRAVVEQNQALQRSAENTERRFEELQQAKADVDRQVAQRTAELEATRDELAESLAQVQELSQARRRFFANLSHDLRTPLQLILGPLEDLLEGRKPAGGVERSLVTMRRNGMRLMALIDQILLLARMDAGAVLLTRRRTDTVSLARATLSTFLDASDKRGVEVRFRSPETPVPMVALDRRWIESALANLIDNALRVSESEVEVTVWLDGETLYLAVRDDGPGLGPLERSSIFERFAQGSEKGAAGLGLSIVSEVAALHEGVVRVDSAEGEGTTFTLSIPANAAEDTTESSELHEPTQIAMPLEALTTLGHSSTAVDAPLALVVDDDAEIREFVSGALAPYCRVELAENGREALAMAQRLRPDIVVTDLAMPEMNGLALTRALRADPSLSTTPILLLTAHTGQTSVLDAYRAGASDYLNKPFHVRELAARVQAHLRARQLFRELTHAERLASTGRVAAQLAHQLRNPLNALLSAIQLLPKRLEQPERAQRLLGVMDEASRRIQGLTEDLLGLSGVHKGEHAPFSPVEPLEAALRLFDAQLPHNVSIEADITSTGAVLGRAADFAQVQVALIENAVKAVAKGGRVRVTARDEDGDHVFLVEDSGDGIDPDVEDRIFAPFFTTRDAGHGTGLGLSIARRVVVDHGGEISVGRSELGGACFTVVVPLARAPGEG